MDKLFSIRNLSFSYAQKPVFSHLDLDFEKGLFYGILGPNGCGKTTLLDLMLRNREPESGHITYKGNNISDLSRRNIAREIALVPQDFYINFPFTVREIVMMGRHPYIPRFANPSSEDMDIVNRVMEQMEIEAFSEKYVTNLSGGEKQRVVFARALAQDTPVVIMDEGTSNMDIKHTLQALNIVSNMVKKGGKSVIAAMHNLNLAAAFCDRLLFMKTGQTIMGDTNDVFNEQNIKDIFEVNSKVYFDMYSNSKQVIYRYEK